ncbi:MAG: tRNA uridine-5-carboxymethylaminomethyl(34) synthesis GTPase MnmE, partial [Pseudomonadota bacterium]
MTSSDTIFALASGALPSAVAIIRTSGSAAGLVFERLIGRPPPDRRDTTVASLNDPETGAILDRAVVLWFAGPRSFTGEDVLELQVTGSRALVDRLSELIAAVSGCRPAMAGEFARRAFLAGKMDLTEVEGLADLIDAETRAQREQAMMAAGGQLRTAAEDWRRQILALRADVEALLDFADAELDVDRLLTSQNDDAPSVRIQAICEDIETALQSHERARRISRGLTAAIVGPPNAGKSSLLNHLARSDAAIVSNVPGTTRDVIEVPIDLDGYRMNVVDTAGLRATDDLVEAEGVRRARRASDAADVVIRLLGDDDVAATSEADGEDAILVRSKSDLRDWHSKGAVIDLSAKTGAGIADLQHALVA